tara:strand:- start:721 stop:975 length:255 start_codon:yes stop_codon:yes gene_type:complete
MSKVYYYDGNGEALVDHAIKLGWEWIEESFAPSADDCIDWDKAIAAAVVFLTSKGWVVDWHGETEKRSEYKVARAAIAKAGGAK